jgi:hypothetical protein
MPDHYYDVTLSTALPEGSGVLNSPCKIIWTLADGRQITSSATATVFAWFQPTAARLRSAWAIAEPTGAIKKRVLRISPPGRPVVEREIVGGLVVVH